MGTKTPLFWRLLMFSKSSPWYFLSMCIFVILKQKEITVYLEIHFPVCLVWYGDFFCEGETFRDWRLRCWYYWKSSHTYSRNKAGFSARSFFFSKRFVQACKCTYLFRFILYYLSHGTYRIVVHSYVKADQYPCIVLSHTFM